ncbi:sugar porter family MFS transporter [Flavitalea sp.]|nr:sugar porter family MFS transporter [Flavitalea sp.]
MASSPSYNTTYIVALSFISALGGYLFGFDFAVISGALPFLKDKFNLNEYWEGFATASLALGAMIGCLVSGKIADKKGRKPGLLVAATVFGISSLFMAFAPNREFFIAARFMAGIGVGMASMLSPMYIAEIAPASFRGRMVAINQLTIVLGILITNLVNYSLRNSGEDAWRWMFGLGAIPSLLFFLGVLWLPESPRWLAQNGNPGKAADILTKIGGTAFSNTTITEMQKSFQHAAKMKMSAIFEKNVLPAVMIGIGLAVFQQLCGINVVFNYTATIFESIGASKDDQLLQTVFIGGVNLVFTVLAMLLVDKTGRKPLMLFGAAGLAILYIFISQLLGIKSSSVSWFLLAAIGIYALTLAPVTWVLISEIFPNKVRGNAISIAVLSLWGAYFVLTFTFPVLYNRLQDKTFYVYAVICFIGFGFILKKIKETKGKTLEEMDAGFFPVGNVH